MSVGIPVAMTAADAPPFIPGDRVIVARPESPAAYRLGQTGVVETCDFCEPRYGLARNGKPALLLSEARWWVTVMFPDGLHGWWFSDALDPA